MEIWDCHWLRNTVPICHSIETAFSGDQPCFASRRKLWWGCCPHRKLFRNSPSVQQSAECSPHHLHTLCSVQSTGLTSQVLINQSSKNLNQQSEYQQKNRINFFFSWDFTHFSGVLVTPKMHDPYIWEIEREMYKLSIDTRFNDNDKVTKKDRIDHRQSSKLLFLNEFFFTFNLSSFLSKLNTVRNETFFLEYFQSRTESHL